MYRLVPDQFAEYPVTYIHLPLIYHAAFSVVMEWSGDRSFHIRSIRVYYTMRQSSHQERVYLLPVDL